MQTFVIVTLFLAAIYLTAMSLLAHTKNVKSAIIFQVIPFLLGVCLFRVAFYLVDLATHS